MRLSFKYLIFLAVFFLSSCQTSETLDSNSLEVSEMSDSEVSNAQNLNQQKTDEASMTVVMVPDWCTDKPKSDSAIYVCGIGNSSNLNMSNSKALLDGKSKLASQIRNEITAKMTSFLEDLSNGDDEQIQARSQIVINSVTGAVQVAGFKEIKSEFQNIGSKFQTYVLLEYPVGEANRILYNQIKKDNLLSTQEAADSALKELEAEINKKKSEN